MSNNELNKILLSYYRELLNVSPVIEYDLINKLIKEKGKTFVEQKFSSIVDSINYFSKNNIPSKELYARIFPDLIPTRKGIEAVFKNASDNCNKFCPLYDSSEYIYRQWLINFRTCFLVDDTNGEIVANNANCQEILEEFKLWIHNVPEIYGSFLSIRNNIELTLGELPFDMPTQYSPKNLIVRNDILQKLKKDEIMQITNKDSIIEIKYYDSNIIVTRKCRYPVNPKGLQKWLNKFGINIALITATYLIEFGMPYGGEIIPLKEILRYTSNGSGIVGLLASSVSLLIPKNENGKLVIESWNHPLYQSVVLGLARLEHYLNPSII
jgi:hypothetical protein